MTASIEENLLGRIRLGERNALQELYRLYRSNLYAYCFRLLRNQQDAEDAVHDTFVKIQTNSFMVEKGSSFRSWIYTIARNEAYGSLRKKMVLTALDEEPWEMETPFDKLVDAEQREIVQTILNDLKAEYREVILLCEYDGFSYEEIAAVTGTTLSSVKSRLFKARKAIAEKIDSIM